MPHQQPALVSLLVFALWTASAACFVAALHPRKAASMGAAHVSSDAPAAHASYAGAGPFAFGSQRHIKLQVNVSINDASAAQNDSRSFTIHLSVMFPKSGGLPHPVVLFINGFQMRASFYRAYAERLASWGYVCVQYDDPLLRIIDDATELQFFDPLVAWLRVQNVTTDGFLHGVLDLGSLAVAGHSRGGKLAGLLFAVKLVLVGADRPEIGAAFLVDPVDNTDQTPESAQYPSAVKALAAAGRPFAQLGAGHTGTCNPEGANYKAFFAAAPEGSWQAVVERSGHLQFLSAGRLLDRLLRLLCPGGSSSPSQVMQLALPPLVAWLDRQFRPAASEALQRDFQRWVTQREADGDIAVASKGDWQPQKPRNSGDGAKQEDVDVLQHAREAAIASR